MFGKISSPLINNEEELDVYLRTLNKDDAKVLIEEFKNNYPKFPIKIQIKDSNQPQVKFWGFVDREED
jgi:hypothetical protein